MELSVDGVHTWCSHIDARYRWTDFERAIEDREFYLLALPSGAGAAIPKRLLDAGTEEILRARIREWSPDRGAGLAKLPN